MRRITPLILALLAVLASIAAPSLAAATSVVDQYTEQVPGPGGSEIVNPGQPSGENGPSGSPAGQTEFSPSGDTPVSSDGSASPTVDSSGSAGSGSGSSPATSGGSASDENNPQDTTSGAADSAVAASTESDGMGWIFPAALVLAAVAAIAVAIGRRNRTRPAAR